MKKIITFLVSVTMVASAFAQYGGGKDQKDNGYGNKDGYSNYDKGKDVGYNDGRFKDFYVYSAKEKDMDIAQINWSYDRKIQAVKSRLFMARFKKDQIICQLEDQRKSEIKAVFEKFNSRKNRFGDFGHDSRGTDHDQRKNW